MSFTLPDLAYSYEALEPFIDTVTMTIHHDKHHAGYVNKLNSVLENYPEFASLNVRDLMTNINDVPNQIKADVMNNGGGHANHSFFWPLLAKNNGKGPAGDLRSRIEKDFGDFASFRKTFTNAALTRFGSGWAWLSLSGEGKLIVHSTANQNSPLMDGYKPVLGLDVWEHAYYLKYQNRRADYIEAFWNIVNWEKAGENLMS
ncbi:MAG: superoxide dismutase [Spirochaetales bacterium]|nr:superoxide dismutase [Spirochaetales bacterium]